MSGQDERRERGSCVGKRTSEEVFTRRGRCVPRIVSFSATIPTIAALLAVVCIILAACLFTLLRMYHNGINRHSSKCII